MNNFNNNMGLYNGTITQPVYNNNQHNVFNNQTQGFMPNCSYGNPANSQAGYSYGNPTVNVNTANTVNNSFNNNNNSTYNPNNFSANAMPNITTNVSYDPEQMKKSLREAHEKNEIKSSSNKSGGGLLIFTAISNILSILFLTIISFTDAYDLGNRSYINGIEPVTMYIINAIVCLVGFGISGIIITKMNHLRLDDVLKIKKTNIGDTFKFMFASMGFVYVFNLLLTFMNVNLSLFGFENKMTDLGKVEGLWGYSIYFLSVAIVPPIIEEFLFRGAILGSLRKHGDALAVIVSAVLFGFMHGNFIQTPVTFLTGLILGYLTVKTNSIIPAIILHFINNAWAVIYDILTNVIGNENIMLLIDSSVAIVLLGGGLICTIALIKKYKNDLFTLEKADTETSMSKRLKYTFTTPCMIVFTIYTIFMCFYSAII